MAAIPTEILNEDIKELRNDIRENRTKIDLVKDEVQRMAVAQAQMRVELRDELHKVALTQSEMKGEFRIVKLLVSLVLAGILGATWQFYDLNARVNGIDSRLDKVDSRLDKVDSRLAGLESSVAKMESSIAKILEQTKPAVTPRLP